jgi:hypothetical protein
MQFNNIFFYMIFVFLQIFRTKIIYKCQLYIFYELFFGFQFSFFLGKYFEIEEKSN